MAEVNFQELGFRVGSVFTPAAPINQDALFAGRQDQVRQVVDAINQTGQHAIIFGERGVGKTSLANILSSKVKTTTGRSIISSRVNCDGSDTYSKLWKKILSEVKLTIEKSEIGFKAQPAPDQQDAASYFELGDDVTPDDVKRVLTLLHEKAALRFVIVDEFDRLASKQLKSLFADTIKTLSDHAVPVTVILVGVADTVDELVEQHQSIERALVQVRMPRMSPEELQEIVLNGLNRLDMAIEAAALEDIAFLSQGLPHYTHLLGLYSAREAVDEGGRQIKTAHLDRSIKRALGKAQQSIQGAYYRATMSQRRDNLYGVVLLACALADTDELGYFAPADLRQPMSLIMGRQYDTPNFTRHLSDFCEPSRGPILERTGRKHRYRFRFRNPLMQPYVTMHGVATGRIDRRLRQKIHAS